MFSNLHTYVSHSVSVHCVEVLPWFGTTGFLLMSLSSAVRAGRASRTFVWSNSENSVSREIFVSFLADRVYWISAVVQQGSEHFVTVCDNIFFCETAFSALTNMKTKYRSRLVVESDMRVCLSNITPRIDSLCKPKRSKHIHHTNIVCLPFNPL